MTLTGLNRLILSRIIDDLRTLRSSHPKCKVEIPMAWEDNRCNLCHKIDVFLFSLSKEGYSDVVHQGSLPEKPYVSSMNVVTVSETFSGGRKDKKMTMARAIKILVASWKNSKVRTLLRFFFNRSSENAFCVIIDFSLDLNDKDLKESLNYLESVMYSRKQEKNL